MLSEFQQTGFAHRTTELVGMDSAGRASAPGPLAPREVGESEIDPLAFTRPFYSDAESSFPFRYKQFHVSCFCGGFWDRHWHGL